MKAFLLYLRYHFKSLWHLREFLLDGRRFFHSAGYAASTGKQRRKRAEMTQRYHVLEKGLSLPEPRKGFGRAVARMLLDDYETYRANWHHDPFLDSVGSALDAYFDFNREVAAAQPFRERWNRIRTDSGESGGTIPFPEMRPWSEYAGFVQSRRSLRNFADKAVAKEQIQEAWHLASEAPSACNRQSWNLYYSMDPGQIRRVLGLQGGARGFAEKVPCIIVVTSPLSHYFASSERNQAYIDGGIFAMALVYALHSLGLGSCCLNLAKKNQEADTFREVCGIPKDEALILALAVGHPAEKAKAAKSSRYEEGSGPIEMKPE